MAADHCETETEDPSSLTELHLSISDYPLRDSLLNTLTLRGVTVYSNGPWVQGSLSRPGGGRWESNITPHSPGQPKVYSPRTSTHSFTSGSSAYPLRDSLLNTLILRGVTVYSNRRWIHSSLSRPGGGGESLVSPHSSGQPKVPSPRNVYMLVKSK